MHSYAGPVLGDEARRDDRLVPPVAADVLHVRGLRDILDVLGGGRLDDRPVPARREVVHMDASGTVRLRLRHDEDLLGVRRAEAGHLDLHPSYLVAGCPGRWR